MGRIAASDVIHRPPADVYAYLADPRSAEEWNPQLERVEGDTGPLRVGSRWVEFERRWGRATATEHEAVELEPGRRVVIKVTSGGLRGLHAIGLEPQEEDTLVTSTFDYELSGGMKLMAPLIALFGRGYVRQYLARFKAGCEAAGKRT